MFKTVVVSPVSLYYAISILTIIVGSPVCCLRKSQSKTTAIAELNKPYAQLELQLTYRRRATVNDARRSCPSYLVSYVESI